MRDEEEVRMKDKDEDEEVEEEERKSEGIERGGDKAGGEGERKG